VDNTTSMLKMRNSYYDISMGKPEEAIQLERPRPAWEVNIKNIL